jgi:hypothetical protein
MGKPTMRQRIRDLTETVAAQADIIAARDVEMVARERLTEARVGEQRRQTHQEQVTRVAAQRGLVVYVRALEQLDHWLRERPALRGQLEPALRELGLWEIALGYDPELDITLSAIWPGRV